MPYRVTKRSAETLAKMRQARAAKRIEGQAPDYPSILPELRRRIVVTDYDFGEVTHTLDLYRTSRIDCYRVHVDGVPWKARMGWSQILASLRKSLPRVEAS